MPTSKKVVKFYVNKETYELIKKAADYEEKSLSFFCEEVLTEKCKSMTFAPKYYTFYITENGSENDLRMSFVHRLDETPEELEDKKNKNEILKFERGTVEWEILNNNLDTLTIGIKLKDKEYKPAEINEDSKEVFISKEMFEKIMRSEANIFHFSSLFSKRYEKQAQEASRKKYNSLGKTQKLTSNRRREESFTNHSFFSEEDSISFDDDDYIPF